MPQIRNVSAIRKISESMNGVAPMIAPVSGSRSGAPDGNVSSTIPTMQPMSPYSAKRSPRASPASVDLVLRLLGHRRHGTDEAPTAVCMGRVVGSITLAVTNAATPDSSSVDTMAK